MAFRPGRAWPGHHIRALQHGRDLTNPNNVIPAEPCVHDNFCKKYPACYAGQASWKRWGPLGPTRTTNEAHAHEQLARTVLPKPLPEAPASPEEIADFERRMGWRLDPDLRSFYLHCNGAALLRWPDSPYEILPLSEIVRARVAIRREDTDAWGPASMYALCFVRDGNYVVLDVSRQVNGRYPLIDGCHETWPDPEYCGLVASTFSEFLEQVLRTRRSLYWLGE